MMILLQNPLHRQFAWPQQNTAAVKWHCVASQNRAFSYFYPQHPATHSYPAIFSPTSVSKFPSASQLPYNPLADFTLLHCSQLSVSSSLRQKVTLCCFLHLCQTRIYLLPTPFKQLRILLGQQHCILRLRNSRAFIPVIWNNQFPCPLPWHKA